jgi:hypothetical protein
MFMIPSTLASLHFLDLRLRFAILVAPLTYIKPRGTLKVNTLEMVILLGTDSFPKY